MRRYLRSRSLIAISAIAVLIPAAVLSWLHYRSLQQLRARSRIVAQEQVRQVLEELQQRLQEQVVSIASESLVQVNAGDLNTKNLDATGAKFQAILKKYPAIGHLFAVSECPCAGKPYAIVSSAEGAGWIKCSNFNDALIADAIRAHRGARGLPKDGDFADVLYFQSGLRPSLYAFHYLPGPMAKASLNNLGIRNPKDSGRWAGLEIQSDALLRVLAPKLLADLKQRGKEPADGFALAVTESGRGPVFSTVSDSTAFDVSVRGGPMFPLWTFTGRHQGETIETLAQAQFRNGLALAAVVLCCVVLAMTLALRAVAREAKLAELKSGFVSNVSHEMKTPLSLIRVFAETLELGRITDPAKRQEYYHVIHSESRRLTQLIDNVLDFSSMEGGRKKYKFERAGLPELVSTVLKPYEHHIRSSGFTLAVSVEDPVPPASVDRDALSQALLNLIDNAMKYSPSGKEVSIRVWRFTEQEVAIQVADEGIGIPKQEQRRIFEKFYRVNNGLVHDTKGSGLGLALTRHIVEAHGGRIEVDSEPGRGSRFTIFLPVVPPAAPQLHTPLTGEPLAEASHR